jgi:hypothetical protein
MLSTKTHTGKMSSSHGTHPAVNSNTRPVTAPSTTSQRGTSPSEPGGRHRRQQEARSRACGWYASARSPHGR